MENPKILLILLFIIILIELLSFLFLVRRNNFKLPKRFGFNFNFESRHQYDPMLGYRYFPNSKYGNLLTGQDGLITNQEDKSEIDSRNEDRFRIFILGGSTVAGTGASATDQTLPAQIEKLLRVKLSEKIDVINCGVGGYATPQEALMLLDLIRKKPNLILTYDGWNDFAYPVKLGGYLTEWEKQNAPQANNECFVQFKRSFRRLNAPKIEFYGLRFDFLHFLQSFYSVLLLKKILQRFGIFESFTNYLANTSSELTTKHYLTSDEAANLYFSNITAIRGVCTSFEIPCYSFLQPTLVHKAKRSSNEMDLLRSRSIFKDDGEHKINQFFGSVLALNKEANCPLVDLTHIFDNDDEDVFVDECHINDSGNNKVAGVIARHIMEKVKCLIV